jgi:hypothetical protein
MHPTERWGNPLCGLLSDSAIDALAKEVGVPVVADVPLDHVHQRTSTGLARRIGRDRSRG